jgi:ribose transport system substrate-binding protein
MRSAPIWRPGVIFATVSMLALATACGGSDKATDSTASGSSESPAAVTPSTVEGSSESSTTVTQASAVDYLKPPEKLPVTTPLSKPAPTGLHVVLIALPFSQSISLTKGFEEAAAVLNWSVTTLTYDPANPAQLGTSMDTAISQKPDAIVVLAQTQQIASYIPQAKAAGIALIPAVTPDKAEEGVYPILRPEANYRLASKMIVDTLVADAAGKTAHILELHTPEVEAILGTIRVSVKAELSKVCADCTHDVLDVPLADLFSGQYVQQVVSYLQSHPDVKYIISESGQLASGLYAAFASAGISDVTIYGLSATDETIKGLVNGAKGAWSMDTWWVYGWIMADHVARIAVGDPSDVWDDYQLTYLVTSANAADVKDPADPIFPADYKEEFQSMWGK